MQVLIAFFQVVSTFSSNYKTQWPQQQSQMFNGGGGTRLDFIALPSVNFEHFHNLSHNDTAVNSFSVQVNCVFAELSYLSQLMIYTLVPIGIVILLAIPRIIVTIFPKRFEDKVIANVKSQFWSDNIVIPDFLEIIFPGFIDLYWTGRFNGLFFLFLVYPTLSLSCLRTFLCRPIGNSAYLVADYRQVAKTTHCRGLRTYRKND
jgi:hypothetical protein